MKDYQKKCVNVRDLILTFGDEHPLFDRLEWKRASCPIDYWKWVSVKLNESEQALVSASSDERAEKEKLFFFEVDSDGEGKRVVSGRKKNCLDARRKLMSILGANCTPIQEFAQAQ